LTREAPFITHLRPRAAAAPSPARPRPPANTGFSNNESRGRKDFGGLGFDIASVVGRTLVVRELVLKKVKEKFWSLKLEA
jgi:hypothetical protein